MWTVCVQSCCCITYVFLVLTPLQNLRSSFCSGTYSVRNQDKLVESTQSFTFFRWILLFCADLINFRSIIYIFEMGSAQKSKIYLKKVKVCVDSTSLSEYAPEQNEGCKFWSRGKTNTYNICAPDVSQVIILGIVYMVCPFALTCCNLCFFCYRLRWYLQHLQMVITEKM